MTAMTALYTASATATGEGRNGHSRSSDGIIDVDLATPVEMGGPGGATNPEQLFAAGYAACFLSALKLIARRTEVAGRRCRRHRRHLAEPERCRWLRPGRGVARRDVRSGPGDRPMIWSRRPIRCARTPTRPAGTSRSRLDTIVA